MVLDLLPGCADLAVAADAAAEDDRFGGVPEGELVGVLCAWDRVEAYAAARSWPRSPAPLPRSPRKAKERRETLAKFARVERWAEDSGNAALMGRELPPDEVLAADERITAWAGELKKAGLDGGMDEIRARAYLDLLLGKDSCPRQDGAEPAAQPPVPQGSPGGSP